MRTGPNGEKRAVNVVADIAPSLNVATGEAERHVNSGENACGSQSGNAWTEVLSAAVMDGAEMVASNAQSR